MRLSNADLAAALRQQYAGNSLMQCLAQIMIERPTSKALNALALRAVNLPALPEETWSAPLPTLADAEAQLAAAIQAMNSGYNESPAHAEIHARRVAWAATTVARLLEWQRQVTTKEWTENGTFETFAAYDGKPLNTAAGRAAVIDDVTKYLNERVAQ